MLGIRGVKRLFYLFCQFSTECELSWHPKCTTDLSDIPCIIRTRRDEDDDDDNDDYIDLLTVSTMCLI